MSKFILFDAVTNVLAARYDSEINDVIPPEAVEVTGEQFFQTINEQDGLWSITSDAEIVKLPPKAPTLAELKASKIVEIRMAYEAAALTPVDALGFTWDGGFDSAIKLDAAKRLCEAAGQTSVTFFDTNNVAHDLNFTDALTVCISVAVAFQIQLAKKQTLFAQINAATSKTQVAAISW